MQQGEIVFWIFMIVLTPISVGSFLAVMWWMARPRRDTESAERVDHIWQQRDNWGEALCRQLIERQVEPGMTPEMVRLAWGDPQAVRQPEPDVEQWLYDDAPPETSTNYVSFKADRVTTAAKSTPKSMLAWGPWPIIVITLGISILVSMIALGVVFFS
ncbi:MAG: hypothetical protein KDI79_05225 [Anaerolineae bacterium]|nr:hypothetical protein [Anaerolineae bacterium]